MVHRMIGDKRGTGSTEADENKSETGPTEKTKETFKSGYQYLSSTVRYC